MEADSPTKPKSKGGKAPAKCTTKKCPLDKYKITNIEVKVEAPDNIVFMNTPDTKILVTAKVTYQKSADGFLFKDLVTNVVFSFTDPGSNNTEKANSFNYVAGSHYLGKKSNPNAKYWKAHADHAATSPDAFNRTAKATLKVVQENITAETNVMFIPSGVGGDDFRITAKAFEPDGTTLADSDNSDAFVVWRKIRFDNIYEMVGFTHVSTNATRTIIKPVYDPAFVHYSVGARTEISRTNSVKYIGLWGGTRMPQRSWATTQSKLPAETPTATEITKATYTGTNVASLASRVTARQAILVKAQAWADRIDSAFSADMRQWVSDVALPANTITAIEYYHPKFSHIGGDYTTNEWKLGTAAVPAWLRVGAFQKSGGGHYYTNLDPDGLWINWGGLSHGNGIVSVPEGNPVETTKQVVRHEAGHATKSFFKRDVFGPSLDHSASQRGIMYKTTDGGTTFTTDEKKILRGIVP